MWISEVMLQQTRVDTVIPYFDTFLERWPTVEALAAADPDDVRAAWSGLGYYRRARAMLDAAATIARDHRGRLPADLDALRALPGFGRYTAGAVGSIAFGLPTPAVDGNVLRVLARVYGIEGDVTRGDANKRVWARATALADTPDPGDLNQALIELGATVCSWRKPACDACPVRRRCVAFAKGEQATIPPPRVRPEKKRLDVTMLLMLRDDTIVLEQQPEGGLFGGLWCLPMLEGRLEIDGALDEAARRHGFAPSNGAIVAELRRVLTHRHLHVRVVRTTDTPSRVKRPLVRAKLAALSDYGIPTVTTQALRASLSPDELLVAELPDRRSARTRGDRRSLLESEGTC